MHDYEHVWGEWCYQFGPHLLCVIYKRKWPRFWRKVNILRCYECDIEIEEPDFSKALV